jgi:hypothetical protein
MITSTSMHVILMVGIVCLYVLYQADSVKIHKSTEGTTLLFTDAPNFVSTKRITISEKPKYVFVYHEKTQTTDVILMERVKQLIFKKATSKNTQP